MTPDETLLASMYRARATKLKESEVSEGPLPAGSRQEEPPITLGDANVFLKVGREELNGFALTLARLIADGFVAPVGGPSTEGTYAMARFTVRGLQRAGRLVAGNPAS